jgi:predicted DNA binding CopG/RHH family protein
LVFKFLNNHQYSQEYYCIYIMHGLLFLKTLFHPENIQKFIEERSYEKKYQAYKEEKEIEYSLINGEFLNVKPDEFKDIAKPIKARQKNSVLNIRINSNDLEQIKRKADKLGVKYQSFISELLHRVAHS